jgi:hypothetical protein
MLHVMTLTDAHTKRWLLCLQEAFAAVRTPPVDGLRIKKLRSMVRQAIEPRDSAEQLIVELSGHLHPDASSSRADDRIKSRVDQRRKPRTD